MATVYTLNMDLAVVCVSAEYLQLAPPGRTQVDSDLHKSLLITVNPAAMIAIREPFLSTSSTLIDAVGDGIAHAQSILLQQASLDRVFLPPSSTGASQDEEWAYTSGGGHESFGIGMLADGTTPWTLMVAPWSTDNYIGQIYLTMLLHEFET